MMDFEHKKAAHMHGFGAMDNVNTKIRQPVLMIPEKVFVVLMIMTNLFYSWLIKPLK